MMRHTSLARIILFSASVLFAHTSAADPTQDAQEITFGENERLKAELVWYEGALVPGRPANLGMLMHIAPHWHIQAGQGSGDVAADAFPTTIELDLPEGWQAQEVLWPEAVTFTVGEGEFALEQAGYEGTALAVVPITLPADTAPGDYEVTARIQYQACDPNVCEQDVQITVSGIAPVVTAEESSAIEPIDTDLARLFEQVFQREPGTAQEIKKKHGVRLTLKELQWWIPFALVVLAMAWMIWRTFVVSSRPVTQAIVLLAGVAAVYFSFVFVRGITASFPWVRYSHAALDESRGADRTVLIKFTANWCANCQVNERIILANEELIALLKSDDVVPMKVDFTGEHPEGDERLQSLGGGGIPVIAIYQPGEEEPIVIRGPIPPSASNVLAAVRGDTVERAAEGQVVFDFLGWTFTVSKDATWLILTLAFIAGFFLNFTPCVLPVIPIKVLSLQTHAKDPARCFFLGLMFGIGIVAAFALLGVLMAGLIAALGRLDWGEFWKHWWISGPIGLIIAVMAMGLVGAYAIRLPKFLYMFDPQSDKASGSFSLGVFTAILSTPCTGPLLGAAAAWVLTQPPLLALLTILVMGLGMAFPYVLLTANPKWLERLPRTGPGSELVKQVMALLLLAVSSYFIILSIISFKTTYHVA